VWWFIIAAMLCLSSRFGWFGIISILLEKQFKPNFKRNSNLILLWLFAALLLRNLYTSQMYSHLTKLPPPVNLPKTIQQLFRNESKLQVLAEYSLASQISQHQKFINGYKTVSLNFLSNVDSLVAMLRRIKVIFTRTQVPNFIKNMSHYVPLICEDYMDRRLLYMEDREDFKHCKTLDRFAVLSYSVGSRKSYSSRFILPALEIFGNRRIINPSNDLGFMTKPMFWFSRKKLFFFEQVASQIASMVDSGLYSFYKENHDIFLQTEILKTLNGLGMFEKPWNFFTYAVQKIRRTRSGVKYSKSDKEQTAGKHKGVRITELQPLFILCLQFFAVCGIFFLLEFLDKKLHSFK